VAAELMLGRANVVEQGGMGSEDVVGLAKQLGGGCHRGEQPVEPKDAVTAACLVLLLSGVPGFDPLPPQPGGFPCRSPLGINSTLAARHAMLGHPLILARSAGVRRIAKMYLTEQLGTSVGVTYYREKVLYYVCLFSLLAAQGNRFS
jgi:hypothetical protein